jgi:hypothetical protein
MEKEPSAFGAFGRKIAAWIVLIAIAVIALKVVFGVIAGFVMTLFWIALLAALGLGAVWALRRV